MKRGLLFSLCAVALVAIGSTAQAQNVSLSLNLRYTNPGIPSLGGTWQLVAETDSAFGIAGISAYLSNVSTAGVVYGNGGSITATTLGAMTVGNDGVTPYVDTFGTAVNVVYGQNTAAGPIILNVGRGDAVAAPGELATDPLFNATWNGASLIASGAFAGGGNAGNQFNRPAFVAAGANSTDANTLATGSTTPPSNSAVNAATTTTVRGDSVKHYQLEDPAGVEGLEWGDASRNFAVGTEDFNAVFNNFFTSGKTWDQGDVGGVGATPLGPAGDVGTDDFNSVFNNFFTNQTPPSVGAVPEPATAALAAMGLMGALLVRRKK